jgi:hypothetical protein
MVPSCGVHAARLRQYHIPLAIGFGYLLDFTLLRRDLQS